MAHKTLIGGTAYEIKGGKTLVNGTAYKIKGGKTLVGGTAYDVSFAPKIVTVTLVYGTLTTSTMKVTIDDTEYGNKVVFGSGDNQLELQVPIGQIKCRGSMSFTYLNSGMRIIVNGEIVAEAIKPSAMNQLPTSCSYYYTLRGNVQIAWSLVDKYETLTITEE